jgi:hypothetical protein
MEVKCKVRYASYSISSSNDAVFKDGHRMFRWMLFKILTENPTSKTNSTLQQEIES